MRPGPSSVLLTDFPLPTRMAVKIRTLDRQVARKSSFERRANLPLDRPAFVSAFGRQVDRLNDRLVRPSSGVPGKRTLRKIESRKISGKFFACSVY